MRDKLVLYIACSLDGYIADKDGGIDFLNETTLEAMGYDSFYETTAGRACKTRLGKMQYIGTGGSNVYRYRKQVWK